MRKALMLTTVMTGALAATLWQAPAPISFAAAERVRLRATSTAWSGSCAPGTCRG